MAGESSHKSSNRPPVPPGERTCPVLVPQGVLVGQPDVPLDRPVTTVGSNENARLHLVSRTVSRGHAIFVNNGPSTYVADLASRTGVLVNGKLVKDADLKTGDRVQIGKFVFRYRSPSKSPRGPIPEAPPASVIVVGWPAMPVVSKVVQIGRRETSDIALADDAAVSAAHAVIFQMSGNWYIRDVGSRTGTTVNGKPIHQQQLNFGDRIVIGSSNILFQPGVVEEEESLEPEIEEAPAAVAMDLDEGDDLSAPAAAAASVADDLPLGNVDWKSAFPVEDADKSEETQGIPLEEIAPEPEEVAEASAAGPPGSVVAREPIRVDEPPIEIEPEAIEPSPEPEPVAVEAFAFEEKTPALEEAAATAPVKEPAMQPEAIKLEPEAEALPLEPLAVEESEQPEEPAADSQGSVLAPNEEPAIAIAPEAEKEIAVAPVEEPEIAIEQETIEPAAAVVESPVVPVEEIAMEEPAAEPVAFKDSDAALTFDSGDVVTPEETEVAAATVEEPVEISAGTEPSGSAAGASLAEVPTISAVQVPVESPAIVEPVAEVAEEPVVVQEAVQAVAEPVAPPLVAASLPTPAAITVVAPVIPVHLTEDVDEFVFVPTDESADPNAMPEVLFWGDPELDAVAEQAVAPAVKSEPAPAPAVPAVKIEPAVVEPAAQHEALESSAEKPGSSEYLGTGVLDESTPIAPRFAPPIAPEPQIEAVTPVVEPAAVETDVESPAAEIPPTEIPAEPVASSSVEEAESVPTLEIESDAGEPTSIEPTSISEPVASESVEESEPALSLAAESDNDEPPDFSEPKAAILSDGDHADEPVTDVAPAAEPASPVVSGEVFDPASPVSLPEDVIALSKASVEAAGAYGGVATGRTTASPVIGDLASAMADARQQLDFIETQRQSDSADFSPATASGEHETHGEPVSVESTDPVEDPIEITSIENQPTSTWSGLSTADEAPTGESLTHSEPAAPVELDELPPHEEPAAVEPEAVDLAEDELPADVEAVAEPLVAPVPFEDVVSHAGLDVAEVAHQEEAPLAHDEAVAVEPEPVELIEAAAPEEVENAIEALPANEHALAIEPEPMEPVEPAEPVAVEHDGIGSEIEASPPHEDAVAIEPEPMELLEPVEPEAIADAEIPSEIEELPVHDEPVALEAELVEVEKAVEPGPSLPEDFDFKDELPGEALPTPEAAWPVEVVEELEFIEPEPIEDEAPTTTDWSGVSTVEKEPAAESLTHSAPAVEPAAETDDLEFLEFTDIPAEPAKAEQPPVAGAPVAGAPVSEAPVSEAPVSDAPVSDAPISNAPVAEAPVAPAPVVEPPAAEAERPGSAPAKGKPTGPSLFGFDFEGGSFLGGMPLPLNKPAAGPVPAPVAKAPPKSPAFNALATPLSGLGAMAGIAGGAVSLPAPAPRLNRRPKASKPEASPQSAKPGTPKPESPKPGTTKPATPNPSSLTGLVSDAHAPWAKAPVIPPTDRTQGRKNRGQNRPMTSTFSVPGAAARNAEVFSQMAAPIGVEVFGGKPGNPDQFIVPESKDTAPDLVTRDELAKVSPPPGGVLPYDRKPRRSRLPLLILALLGAPVLIWQLSYRFMPVSNKIVGTIQFTGLDEKNDPVGAHNFVAMQESRLYSDEVRKMAVDIMTGQHKAPGFLDDSTVYAQTVDKQYLNWNEGSSSLDFTYDTSDAALGKLRVAAVLAALKQKDQDLQNARQRAQDDLDVATARVNELKASHDKLMARDEELIPKAEDRPDNSVVTQDDQDVIAANQKLADAKALTQTNVAYLADLKAQDPTKPIDIDNDPQVLQLQKDLQPLNDQIRSIKSGGVTASPAPGNSTPGIGTDVSVNATTQPAGAVDPLLPVLQEKVDALQKKLDSRKADLAAQQAIDPAQRVVNRDKQVENLSVAITGFLDAEVAAKKAYDAAVEKAAADHARVRAAMIAEADKQDIQRQIRDNERLRLAMSEDVAEKQSILNNCVTVAGNPVVSDPKVITDLRPGSFALGTTISTFLIGLMILGELRRPKLIISAPPAAAPLVNPPTRVIPWPQPHELDGLKAAPRVDAEEMLV